MKVKYKTMKCPYCKVNMYRTELTFCDWICDKCKRCFKGGTEVKTGEQR